MNLDRRDLLVKAATMAAAASLPAIPALAAMPMTTIEAAGFGVPSYEVLLEIVRTAFEDHYGIAPSDNNQDCEFLARSCQRRLV